MDVERTALPGIGLQHVLTTGRGRQIGVVSHRTGRKDLVIYDKDDPDSCVVTVKLTTEEANAIAELLGTGRVVERLADLHRQVEGLITEQIPIAPGSPYAGRPLADARVRTRTGASIVAIVRDGQVIASPRPDFTIEASDIVVVVGTDEGVSAVTAIFTQG
ncbi:cation:proton antiporter regulatory subunit [Actinomadura rugatobispora]|uniref:Cation:proton antiporter regulatory subunit n=1 Tax=Actinomadura rugatobispora TaxID=1994 RepID=A0ABW0ZQB8_9ACTN|nr:cation:proton antiporter regulatory subunit [Actinomadura rugatobispora]